MSKTSNFKSDPCENIEDACKNLESKMLIYHKSCIVTLGDETLKPILSPRGNIPRIAIARIDGKDYDVIFIRDKTGLKACTNISSN